MSDGPRTFKVEVEVKDGRAEPHNAVYPITFELPESRGPTSTLRSIAVNQVERQFYASPTFRTLGKNWTIKRVFEVENGN